MFRISLLYAMQTSLSFAPKSKSKGSSNFLVEPLLCESVESFNGYVLRSQRQAVWHRSLAHTPTTGSEPSLTSQLALILWPFYSEWEDEDGRIMDRAYTHKLYSLYRCSNLALKELVGIDLHLNGIFCPGYDIALASDSGYLQWASLYTWYHTISTVTNHIIPLSQVTLFPVSQVTRTYRGG